MRTSPTPKTRYPSARSLGAVLVVALAVGCSGDPTSGPDRSDRSDRFDPAKVQAGVAAMDRALGTSAMASFRAASQHLSDPGSGPGMAIGKDRLSAAVERIVSVVGPRSGAALVPILRSSVLGRTFVYDPTAQRYVVDSARTGAPANGVRFVLYQVDQEGGFTLPLVETGTADLTDDRPSAPNAVGLRLRVVSHGTTYLDYGFEISGSVGAATFRVAGFLSDGTERVEFDLAAQRQLFGAEAPVEIHATIKVPSQHFQVVTDASLGSQAGRARVELVATTETDRVAIRADLAPASVDATIEVNGHLLARVTGSPESPVITGEGGRELTADEMAALAGVVGLMEGILKLIGDLFAPLGYLLLLGLGL